MVVRALPAPVSKRRG
uniref:Uncharacterized protein n=1 Tax=Arundo donax TaxID=35708 RepID=A0A0A9SAN0_ARUDO